jgi:hypothetical protein
MRIEEMINVWVEYSDKKESAVGSKLGFNPNSAVLQSGGSSWKTLEDYEDDFLYSVYHAMEALIFGVGRDYGILTALESSAVLNNHMASAFKSARGINLDSYYEVAKYKLKQAMSKRGFIVD